VSDSLRAALLEFDGKALSYLSETRVRFRDCPDYLEQLVALAGDRTAHIDSGATWLLKDHFEQGGNLNVTLVEPFLQHLIAAPSWSAALHILQSVQHLDLSRIDALETFATVSTYTEHARPFLRAWAVDAMWRVAGEIPDLHARARQAIEKALQDPAASVRARARQLEKEMAS